MPYAVPLLALCVHPWIIPPRLAVIMVALKNLDCLQNPVSFSFCRSRFSGSVISSAYLVMASCLSRASRAPNRSNSNRSMSSACCANCQTYSSSSVRPVLWSNFVSSNVKKGLSMLPNLSGCLKSILCHWRTFASALLSEMASPQIFGRGACSYWRSLQDLSWEHHSIRRHLRRLDSNQPTMEDEFVHTMPMLSRITDLS